MLETCAVCGSEVAFRHTVHVMLNTQDEDGVVDHYVCRSCYEADLEPLFAVEPADDPADPDAAPAEAPDAPTGDAAEEPDGED